MSLLANPTSIQRHNLSDEALEENARLLESVLDDYGVKGAIFIFLIRNNVNIFSLNEPVLSFYLFWAGLMTLIPLFWYTKGFGLIGIGPASMIFFLTPTAQFFLGLYYYNEPLILDELVSFVFIWIAVIVYLNELRKE